MGGIWLLVFLSHVDAGSCHVNNREDRTTNNLHVATDNKQKMIVRGGREITLVAWLLVFLFHVDAGSCHDNREDKTTHTTYMYT